MNGEAAQENQWTLQQLLGMSEDESEKIIGSMILISGSPKYPFLASSIKMILQKTFERVDFEIDTSIKYSCEIILGSAIGVLDCKKVFIGQDEESGNIVISVKRNLGFLSDRLHNILYFISACYSGGMVLGSVVSETLPVTHHDEIIIEIAKLIPNETIFNAKVDFGEIYLAGAGAIGNSFLAALATFDVMGKINVVDPDEVSGGNINRCLFFSDDDITKDKVYVLRERTQSLLPNVLIEPYKCLLNKVPAAADGGAWLKKLVVAVDSRRARRRLQEEIPGEVFDASTTGISEVVIHHHKRPTQNACLGCIYVKESLEDAHEKHIAETLGVSIEEVKVQFIEKPSAEKIVFRYPELDMSEIVGKPYDTLFKQLCGAGHLKTVEDKQVLAPLAFVSALAGAFLALNLIENHLGGNAYNYWRVSPWVSPNYKLQQIYPIIKDCEFCNDETYMRVANGLWG